MEELSVVISSDLSEEQLVKDGYEIINAKISSRPKLWLERNMLLFCLDLEYTNGGQGFGPYILCTREGKYNGNDGSSEHYRFGTDEPTFLPRLFNTVGVLSLDDFEGTVVRVARKDKRIFAIGNAIKDNWFSPQLDAETAESKLVTV